MPRARAKAAGNRTMPLAIPYNRFNSHRRRRAVHALVASPKRSHGHRLSRRGQDVSGGAHTSLRCQRETAPRTCGCCPRNSCSPQPQHLHMRNNSGRGGTSRTAVFGYTPARDEPYHTSTINRQGWAVCLKRIVGSGQERLVSSVLGCTV